jgi:hypothetical protein
MSLLCGSNSETFSAAKKCDAVRISRHVETLLWGDFDIWLDRVAPSGEAHRPRSKTAVVSPPSHRRDVSRRLGPARRVHAPVPGSYRLAHWRTQAKITRVRPVDIFQAIQAVLARAIGSMQYNAMR